MNELREIVEAATPGPWLRDGRENLDRFVYAELPEPGADVAQVLYNDDDAAYIATFDPVLVSALLDVAEAAGSFMESVVPVAHPRVFELRSSLGRLNEVQP